MAATVAAQKWGIEWYHARPVCAQAEAQTPDPVGEERDRKKGATCVQAEVVEGAAEVGDVGFDAMPTRQPPHHPVQCKQQLLAQRQHRRAHLRHVGLEPGDEWHSEMLLCARADQGCEA